MRSYFDASASNAGVIASIAPHECQENKNNTTTSTSIIMNVLLLRYYGT